MISQILKIGFFYQIWRWLKPRLRSLLIALLLICITWVIHSEYTAYLQQSNSTQYLGISYLFKWIITLAIIFITYVREKLRLKTKKTKSAPDITSKVDMDVENTIHDPFGRIRSKKNLDNRVDKLIKSK